MKASIVTRVTRAALALLGATLLVPAAMAEDAIPAGRGDSEELPAVAREQSLGEGDRRSVRNPSTDDCCMYLNPCSVPSGWESYNFILECKDA